MNEIDIKNIETSCFNEDDVIKLLKRVASGKAILFTGAGFSSSAINIEGGSLPVGKKLANEIDFISGEDSLEDLCVATDYAIDNGYSEELISLIKDLFTVREIQPYHKTIISIPWRRYYTTNYDAVIERAGTDNGKRIKCITTSDSVTDNLREKNLCVHINGRIDSLNSETLNTGFKLSESSYLHHDALNDTQWVDVFTRDLQHASAIVFVGYSMYDYNIKKLLFKFNENLKEKIYFITSEKPCSKTKTEQKYGNVINIGVEKFAQYIEQNQNIISEYAHPENAFYESIKQYTITEDLKDITHDMIRDFLIFGRYDWNYINHAIYMSEINNHLIIPSWTQECYDLLIQKENRFVHISGELGTGKSVGTKVIASLLIGNGENVFFLHDKYGDFVEDINKLLEKYNERVYIFVDNAAQNMGVIRYLYSLNSPKICCISVGRKNLRTYDEDNVLYSNTKNVVLDNMSNSDIIQLIKIIENIGSSGRYSARGIRKFIEHSCSSSLPSFLLDFLQSQEIGKSIGKSIKELILFKNGKYRDTIMALNLLGVVNVELSFSTVATLTNNSNIRNNELMEHSAFQNFFYMNREKIEAKSPIFSIYILQNHYLDAIKRDAFIKFACIADKNKLFRNLNDKSLNNEYEELFKALVKFVSLSKLFSEGNYDIILSYFEQLKIELYWLKKDPNYWLQLAILNLARGKLDIAKNEIETARKTAMNKQDNYRLDYIDTVEARYKLELALIARTHNREAYQLFQEADNLLRGVEGSNQKYRQIDKYVDVYNKIKTFLSEEEKLNFIQRVKTQIHRIKELEYEGYPGIDKIHLIHNCEGNLSKIIDLI